MNYKVYQGSELKQTVTSKTAVMNGLQPNKTYDFSVQPSDGTRDGKKATTFVTTRGIRFNIPKTLTVGSTITLRYEEYPLGIVPIGNEPSGMFGGGNKQNLSAKVISTANGSSIVEVAGNAIDVGNKNLINGSYDSPWSFSSNGEATIQKVTMDSGEVALHVIGTTGSSGFYMFLNFPSGEYTVSVEVKGTGEVGALGWERFSQEGMTPTSNWQRVSRTVSYDGTIPAFILYGIMDVYVRLLKLEPGTIATPYAAFVDGDTFTVQPDGTCALFSEYKALYY